MDDRPDFSVQGYQIVRQIGANLLGGRTVFLAEDIESQLVVIKQFQFARHANWQGLKQIERER